MLSIKKDLLAALAAMQLAKPFKLNPRQVEENLRTVLLQAPAFGAGSTRLKSPGRVFSTSGSSRWPIRIPCAKCCEAAALTANSSAGRIHAVERFGVLLPQDNSQAGDAWE
jgi:hypothetical protein